MTDREDSDDRSGAPGAQEVYELVGWHPYPPPAPEPMRWEAIPGMTDDEVLAFYRARDVNPYMTLCTARALYALTLKHRSTARAVAQAGRDAAEAQRERLRVLVNGKAAGGSP